MRINVLQNMSNPNSVVFQHRVPSQFKSNVTIPTDSFSKTTVNNSKISNIFTGIKNFIKDSSTFKFLLALGLLASSATSCVEDKYLGKEEEPAIVIPDNPELIENTSDILPELNDYNINIETDEFNDNIIYLTDKENNISICTIDLNKLLSTTNEQHKAEMIKTLKSLEPITLLDLSNEMSISSIVDENFNGRCYGFYDSKTDRIEWRERIPSVIIHELGHAVSFSVFNNSNSFMPEFSQTFYKTFEQENAEFIKKTEFERRMNHIDSDYNLLFCYNKSEYLKSCAGELFADYYEYLYNPNAVKRYYNVENKAISEWDFFPNSTKLIRKYLNYVRSNNTNINRKLQK